METARSYAKAAQRERRAPGEATRELAGSSAGALSFASPGAGARAGSAVETKRRRNAQGEWT